MGASQSEPRATKGLYPSSCKALDPTCTLQVVKQAEKGTWQTFRRLENIASMCCRPDHFWMVIQRSNRWSAYFGASRLPTLAHGGELVSWQSDRSTIQLRRSPERLLYSSPGSSPGPRLQDPPGLNRNGIGFRRGRRNGTLGSKNATVERPAAPSATSEDLWGTWPVSRKETNRLASHHPPTALHPALLTGARASVSAIAMASSPLRSFHGGAHRAKCAEQGWRPLWRDWCGYSAAGKSPSRVPPAPLPLCTILRSIVHCSRFSFSSTERQLAAAGVLAYAARLLSSLSWTRGPQTRRAPQLPPRAGLCRSESCLGSNLADAGLALRAEDHLACQLPPDSLPLEVAAADDGSAALRPRPGQLFARLVPAYLPAELSSPDFLFLAIVPQPSEGPRSRGDGDTLPSDN
ncbi:hypothetical protein GQ53DRAFT_774516 [Thozetella sp. PMI_491]|nr:hypothetical protein GQ53DRAFT_774516 [Thozetella sp. PMI_491]